MSIQPIVEQGNKGSSNLTNTAFALLVGLVAIGSALAQTVKTVHSFSGPDGEFPQNVVLVQGRDGRLYGTADLGGASGMGTIFKQRTTGNGNVVLYNFGGPDGAFPSGGLTLATDGNYYGVTAGGGSASGGVLFRVTSGGVLTVLHNFTGGSDGAYPVAPPIQAIDGSLYGTTSGGGLQNPTIYKYTSSGDLSTVYVLAPEDGTFLFAPVLQTKDGSLFAAPSGGGAKGCGSILKLTTAGVVKGKHTFNCGSGGGAPNDLLQATDGNIYGTTQAGGEFGGGIVFKLDPKGIVTVVYSFGATITDGLNPNGGLKQGTDGNFYSSTQNGGVSGAGTLFQVTSAGVYKQLYSFPKVKDSTQAPLAAPMQFTGGISYGYGVTTSGGANGLGSVYTLDMGLGPFIAFVRPQGKIGATAQILGTALTGATSVTFNGIKADTFKVVSDTYMTAVVPSGATTGPVVVTTPSGMLTSNKSFRVSK